MGWQTIGSGQYYTRSVRESGRVRREYVGGGEAGRAAARADARKRQEEAARRAERRQAQRAESEEARLIRWYCGAVESVLHSYLTSAGYHRHDRGAWRKRRTVEKRTAEKRPARTQAAAEGAARMETELQQRAKAELARRQEERKQPAIQVQLLMAAQSPAQAADVDLMLADVPCSQQQRRAIVEAAVKGDAALEAQALACIRAYPSETVLNWGNPEKSCLNLVYASGPGPGVRVIQAMIEAEYKQSQAQIEGDHPTPLETLLAERITVLRFQLTHFERLYECKIAAGGISLDVSDHHAKRIERVGKQYLRAIEALAKVRRLQLPAVLVGQLNIGGKQMNVALEEKRAE